MSDGFTVWLTGLPCSGKSTLANGLAASLREGGRKVEILDGDTVRESLSKGLGFSRADRELNAQRIAFVAELLARNGVIVVVAVVSPFSSTRAEVRRRLQRFVEVYVDCPLAECERRDVKGLYARSRAGHLRGFTGVDAPYESPSHPEVTVRTNDQTAERCVDQILKTLRSEGYLSPAE